MLTPPSLDLHIRSYGDDPEPDQHTFAQLVLPLSGTLHMDIEGRERRIDPLTAAFVAPNAWHGQTGPNGNRSFILDMDLSAVSPEVTERLMNGTYISIGPAAGKLIEAMHLMADVRPKGFLHHWTPLLLDTLTLETPKPKSRLTALQAAIDAQPGEPWTTEIMARFAGLSISRLHAVFQEDLGLTPHGWLAARRIDHARRLLRDGTAPIAEIAFRLGYSDQSALTRAFRDATGMTPAVWRRQENGSKEP
ncbi:AraC family transcriptional regulator [Asticcacaulis sp. BYS171W]|uniref:AraC family transcriptional regulator n=1 Tax=Asticcacaulis aquaticus TaxID=2984212 RepID=A0ABT5HTP1_9CAUL|nr:AraC family transcriptional regulator [Asticcacaulis aquaticus]MDC7682851.1 AraC family transcriptional regulator [Asticcacaulis aquaticus]